MVVPMYPTYFCKRVNFLCFYFSCYSVHVYHLMLSGNFNGSQNWDGIIRVFFFLGGGILLEALGILWVLIFLPI